MPRYDHVGRFYDVVSLERLVYGPPRSRLFEMLGRMPGATAVDVGCGTGLNLPALHRAVGPSGRIVGIDPSPSMLSAARRRVRRARPEGVTLVQGDAKDLEGALRAANVDSDDVTLVVATFVLSLLDDDGPFWHTVDKWAYRRPRRVALADLGHSLSAPAVTRPILRALTHLGGGDPARQPWERLIARDPDAVHETHLGGHVHLCVATCGAAR